MPTQSKPRLMAWFFCLFLLKITGLFVLFTKTEQYAK